MYQMSTLDPVAIEEIWIAAHCLHFALPSANFKVCKAEMLWHVSYFVAQVVSKLLLPAPVAF